MDSTDKLLPQSTQNAPASNANRIKAQDTSGKPGTKVPADAVAGSSVQTQQQEPAKDAIGRVDPINQTQFRQLVFNKQSNESPASRSESLYDLVCSDYKHARELYWFCTGYIYFFYIAQLIFGIALVVLGALPGGHDVGVAVLGAITSVSTGLLTLIRVQGQPTRAYKYANLLWQIKTNIELVDDQLNVDKSVTRMMVDTFRDDYLSARKENTANRPDIWAALGDLNKSGTIDGPSARVQKLFAATDSV